MRTTMNLSNGMEVEVFYERERVVLSAEEDIKHSFVITDIVYDDGNIDWDILGILNDLEIKNLNAKL